MLVSSGGFIGRVTRYYLFVNLFHLSVVSAHNLMKFVLASTIMVPTGVL